MLRTTRHHRTWARRLQRTEAHQVPPPHKAATVFTTVPLCTMFDARVLPHGFSKTRDQGRKCPQDEDDKRKTCAKRYRMGAASVDWPRQEAARAGTSGNINKPPRIAESVEAQKRAQRQPP